MYLFMNELLYVYMCVFICV